MKNVKAKNPDMTGVSAKGGGASRAEPRSKR